MGNDTYGDFIICACWKMWNRQNCFFFVCLFSKHWKLLFIAKKWIKKTTNRKITRFWQTANLAILQKLCIIKQNDKKNVIFRRATSKYLKHMECYSRSLLELFYAKKKFLGKHLIFEKWAFCKGYSATKLSKMASFDVNFKWPKLCIYGLIICKNKPL